MGVELLDIGKKSSKLFVGEATPAMQNQVTLAYAYEEPD